MGVQYFESGRLYIEQHDEKRKVFQKKVASVYQKVNAELK